MMHRRGFSPRELEELDPDLFEQLRIYDQNIEPNGMSIQWGMFAHLCHLILVTSGGLSERDQKNASPLDWDFLGLMRNLTTGELHESLEEKKSIEAQQQIDAIADTIKALATKESKANGK